MNGFAKYKINFANPQLRSYAKSLEEDKYNWSGLITTKKRSQKNLYIVLRHCRGYDECRNSECPYLIISSGIPMVAHNTTNCPDCGCGMSHIPCLAQKATLLDDKGDNVTNMT